MTEWLVVGLESGIFWPTRETAVQFHGSTILMRPETRQDAPSVVLTYEPPISWGQALHLVRQFLSSLAWVEGRHVRETVVTGGSTPIRVGKGPGASLVSPDFRVDYLPDSADPKVRLGLGLYREALGLNSIPYQFLGFFKVINVIRADAKSQIAWLNDAIGKLEDHLAHARLVQLRSEVPDVGEYLYVSGRCAVAHAFNEPIVDPDDPEDTRRLSADLPLIKALAEYAIETELGVRSQKTVWREHLYELDGFRSILGSEPVSRLKEGQTVPREAVGALPRLSLRLRDHPPFPAFENLCPEVLGGIDGRLLVRCRSGDGLVLIGLSLNFAAERLEFDPERSVAVVDDASPVATSSAIDHVRLLKGLVENGELEAWDAERQVLLGRCDPCIPVNIDLAETVRNLDRRVEHLRVELERRTVEPRQVGD